MTTTETNTKSERCQRMEHEMCFDSRPGAASLRNYRSIDCGCKCHVGEGHYVAGPERVGLLATEDEDA